MAQKLRSLHHTAAFGKINFHFEPDGEFVQGGAAKIATLPGETFALNVSSPRLTVNSNPPFARLLVVNTAKDVRGLMSHPSPGEARHAARSRSSTFNNASPFRTPAL
jgi:hypothetical protein